MTETLRFAAAAFGAIAPLLWATLAFLLIVGVALLAAKDIWPRRAILA